MSDDKRVRDLKDPRIEAFINDMNESLQGLENSLQSNQASVELPVYFIIGHQRSGSTLLNQIICHLASVGYPSNLIARFWKTPCCGIFLQNSLKQHLDEQSDWKSKGGVTSGLLGPHEFSYFWNHWFPENQRCRDEKAFRQTLASMQRLFGSPMVFKNLWNTLRVDKLSKILPQARFIRIERSLLDVAHSTMKMREHRFGSREHWIGLTPENYEALQSQSWPEQIAGQLALVEQNLSKDLISVSHDRVLYLSYRELCEYTATAIEKLKAFGIPITKSELPTLDYRTSISMQDPDVQLLQNALKKHFDESEIASGHIKTREAA